MLVTEKPIDMWNFTTKELIGFVCLLALALALLWRLARWLEKKI